MNVKFQVINVDTGEVVLDNLPDAHTANAQREQFVFKTRIQKVATSVKSWQEREAERFTDGTYTPLPDFITNTYWWRDRPEVLKLHFARMSKEKECMIAFVPNEEYGMSERYMRMAPARYLTRYFGDVLPDHIIRDLATGMSTDVSNYKLRISYKQEDFIFAYENQALCADGGTYRSCMWYPATHWRLDIHPAAAYSTYQGDYDPDKAPKDALAIAYVIDPEHDRRVLARCIVWPRYKRYVRIYGYCTEDSIDGRVTSLKHHHIMQTLLANAGFVRRNDLDGARISKVYPTTRSGVVLMPYIDGDTKDVYLAADDNKTLIIGEDHPHCGASFTDGETTGGFVCDDGSDAPDGYCCDNCGESVHEDETTYVRDNGRWCDSCVNDHAFRCEYNEGWYANTDTDSYEVRISRYTYRGEVHYRTVTWSQNAVDRNAIYCERTEEYYHSGFGGFTSIDVITKDGTQVWCKEASEGEYFQCPDCGENYSNDMRSEHADHVCDDCGEKYADGSIPTFTINDPNQLEMEISQ